MRIIEESNATIQFIMLDSGDVFSYKGELYIKIMIGQGENLLFNAVNLRDGEPKYIPAESIVKYQDVGIRVNEF